MKFNLVSSLAFSSMLFFSACKKDDAGSSNAITGKYKFVQLSATTVSTISYTDDAVLYRAVTNSIYTTKNNTGTLEIDGSNINSKGLSYSVDTTTQTDYYEGNELVDFIEMPFKFNVPTSDASTGYKIVTNDSMYVNNGLMFSGGTTTSIEPTGLKYKIEGDKLIFNGKMAQTKTIQQQGVLMNQQVSAVAEITYQKQ